MGKLKNVSAIDQESGNKTEMQISRLFDIDIELFRLNSQGKAPVSLLTSREQAPLKLTCFGSLKEHGTLK